MLSPREIEDQIREYRLRFIDAVDSQIEWGTRLPMFIDTFNRLLQANGRVPSQDDFVKEYFEENSAALNSLISDPGQRIGLEARLRRTYPSFVRDVHLASLLRERGLQVSRSREADVTKGVDHIIQYKGRTFYVHSYVGTRRGKLGRRIKNRRHEFRGIHLNLVLDLGAASAKRIGDFYLYSEMHVDSLIRDMKKSLKPDLTF